MFKKTRIAVLVSSALAIMAMDASAAQGPSSSQNSYLIGSNGASFTSVLTAGDSVGGYQMSGIPDGLGAYDNGDDTFTVLMNHEIPGTSGVARAHGGTGAFVSEWVINKNTLQVQSGGDLIKNVYGWNSATQQSNTATSTVSFSRFCAADLAAPSAFYNAASGLGTAARLFLNGEEGGATGYAMAHVATGAGKGNSFVLGKFNTATNGSGGTAVGGWENLLANPFAQDKTVVIGSNDGGTGLMNNTLAVYVGTKTGTGTDVDKAGLTNGVTKFINIAGFADSSGATNDELNNTTTRTTGITSGTAFTLSDTAATTFSRPEDGVWTSANEFYFVTTDRLDKTDLTGGTQQGGSRLWRLTFNDITNPDAGGTIDLALDTATLPGGVGVDKPNMLDNIGLSSDGSLILQEDVGNAEHNGKIWRFDRNNGNLTLLSKFDPALFGDIVGGSFVAGSHTRDEETSGVIDITDILGRNDGKRYSLLVAQDHATAASLGLANPVAIYEGGQLLVMTTAPVPEPSTYSMVGAGVGLLGFLAARRRKNK
ncbi:MAG: CHU large protein [Gallionellaceae bacterium]|nr:MAG: CHU large protein [Gallionellaceae bacterium]